MTFYQFYKNQTTFTSNFCFFPIFFLISLIFHTHIGRILCKTDLFSIILLLKMSTRRYSAALFAKCGVIKTPGRRFFFVCKRAVLCQVSLTFYQWGHHHLRFIFSSHVVDNFDANLMDMIIYSYFSAFQKWNSLRGTYFILDCIRISFQRILKKEMKII